MFKKAWVIVVLLSAVFVMAVHAETDQKSTGPYPYQLVPVHWGSGHHCIYVFDPNTGRLWQKLNYDKQEVKLKPVLYEIGGGKTDTLPLPPENPAEFELKRKSWNPNPQAD